MEIRLRSLSLSLSTLVQLQPLLRPMVKLQCRSKRRREAFPGVYEAQQL